MAATRDMGRATAVVSAADVSHWDRETDVVVVGFGAAGSCAAIGARETGADVLVLERASGGGGTSANSTGEIYMGGGTPASEGLRVRGLTPRTCTSYLMAASCGPNPDEDEDSPDLLRIRAVDHFYWLEESGRSPSSAASMRDGSYIPTDDCLAWSGSELNRRFAAIAKPAPRDTPRSARDRGGRRADAIALRSHRAIGRRDRHGLPGRNARAGLRSSRARGGRANRRRRPHHPCAWRSRAVRGRLHQQRRHGRASRALAASLQDAARGRRRRRARHPQGPCRASGKGGSLSRQLGSQSRPRPAPHGGSVSENSGSVAEGEPVASIVDAAALEQPPVRSGLAIAA